MGAWLWLYLGSIALYFAFWSWECLRQCKKALTQTELGMDRYTHQDLLMHWGQSENEPKMGKKCLVWWFEGPERDFPMGSLCGEHDGQAKPIPGHGDKRKLPHSYVWMQGGRRGRGESSHASLQLSGMRLQTMEFRIPLPFPRADDLSEIKQINSVSSEEACLTALTQWTPLFSGETRWFN